MPFDLAPKDVTPAQRLAALIEAGRAALPEIEHKGRDFYKDNRACALGFAALAAGATREQIGRDYNAQRWRVVSRVLGIQVDPMTDTLAARVMCMSDIGRTLDEICRSLRSGELSKVAA